MAIYPRSNGRVFNHIQLGRDFFDNGVLFDPYQIDRVEIWKGQYAPEASELLIDTIYGSQVIMHDISNDAYSILGLIPGTQTQTQVGVLAYEEDFVFETDFIVTHNLTDDRPNVVVYDTTPAIIRPDEIIAINENQVQIKFAIPQSGTIKVYGTEELCSSTVYTVNKYEQEVVGLDPVTVNHQLNDNDPRVVVYDVDGNFIYPDDIIIIDDDSLVVEFGSLFSGTIVVMGGIAGSMQTGFGVNPTVTSTKDFSVCGGMHIYQNMNDHLAFTVDGTTEYITLTPMPHASVDDIVGMINAQWTLGKAINYNGILRLEANPYGRDHNLVIESVGFNGADDLGLALGTYNGLGLEPALVEGSKVGPYLIVANVNDMVKVQTNYNDPLTIQLTDGLRSITNIVNDINDAFDLAGYPAVAFESNSSKLAIQSTEMDGIIRRDETGQYYAQYLLDERFIDDGVVDNVYKDVWYYKPTQNYNVDVPDDTCCFLVYPESYYSSCGGYANYNYDFKLIQDSLIKGEKKDIEVGIETLPKYQTPMINDWLLPISEATYLLATFGGQEVIPWTPVNLNTGSSVKIRFDTTTLQDGAYRMRVKLRLPDGQILISSWLRINVIGACTL